MQLVPRRVSWIKAALKAFERFPRAVRIDLARALDIAALGQHPDSAKPLAGLGAGVLELRERSRGNAYRIVYAVKIGEDLWVLHAFEKKSKTGIKTPKPEIDLVRRRLKQLKEKLR